jgi:hypothetical protein
MGTPARSVAATAGSGVGRGTGAGDQQPVDPVGGLQAGARDERQAVAGADAVAVGRDRDGAGGLDLGVRGDDTLPGGDPQDRVERRVRL